MFGWKLTDQGSACGSDVDSFEVSFSWNGEKFLFQTQSHDCTAVFNPKFFQKSLDALAQGSLASSEQSLVVQSVSMMRNQKCWNVKGFVAVSE